MGLKLSKCLLTVGSGDKYVVQGAMDEWKEFTCIEFQPATSSTKNYVLFVDEEG